MTTEIVLTKMLRSEHRAGQLLLSLRLARRQISQRYRETLFGGAWAVLNPLAMLGIYWWVFSEVFRNEWKGPGANRHYALLIFSGLVMFNLYAEIVNGATSIVQNNALLIKRTTVSPKVMPVVQALASLFTLLLSSVPFLVMYLLLEKGGPPPEALLIPVVVIPLLLMSLALSLFIASFSAYFRDLQQVIPLLNTAVLFVSPIFFSSKEMPDSIKAVSDVISPLVVPLEASKNLLFVGIYPDWGPLAVYTSVALVLLVVGWKLYGVASKGFGDVV